MKDILQNTSTSEMKQSAWTSYGKMQLIQVCQIVEPVHLSELTVAMT